MDYQIVSKGKFLFIKVFQLINKEEMEEFEFHHFATPKE